MVQCYRKENILYQEKFTLKYPHVPGIYEQFNFNFHYKTKTWADTYTN